MRYVKVLNHLGMHEGDVVGLCSDNTVDMACIVYACLYLGITANPLNFLYLPNEVTHMWHITQPKIVFCSSAVVDLLIRATEMISNAPTIVVVGSGQPGLGNKTTEELFKETAAHLVPAITKVDVVANIIGLFSSSGTTSGLPKGVALTQKTYFVNHLIMK